MQSTQPLLPQPGAAAPKRCSLTAGSRSRRHCPDPRNSHRRVRLCRPQRPPGVSRPEVRSHGTDEGNRRFVLSEGRFHGLGRLRKVPRQRRAGASRQDDLLHRVGEGGTRDNHPRQRVEALGLPDSLVKAAEMSGSEECQRSWPLLWHDHCVLFGCRAKWGAHVAWSSCPHVF